MAHKLVRRRAFSGGPFSSTAPRQLMGMFLMTIGYGIDIGERSGAGDRLQLRRSNLDGFQ